MKRIFIVLILLLFCISISATAGDKIFSWDKNTESDLLHYTIYRSSMPDVQVDATNLYLKVWKPGENPDLQDPINVEYQDVAGRCVLPRNILPDGVWFFVLTASDNAENESGRSNEVSTIIDDTAPAPPGGFQCS